MFSKQTQAWSLQFGSEYTKRNDMTTKEMDEMYLKRYGTKRSDMNADFLSHMDRNINILEVGSNIGLQLQFLQNMGFLNLYGIEISSFAVELAKQRTKNINIIHGNAMDIPFKSNYFDIVFTSGVLIHINPDDVKLVMSEIYRCSNCFIWGFEYYSEKLVQVKYRNAEQTDDLLWKDNFPRLYKDQFPDLKLLRVKKYSVIGEDYTDVMFLMRKGIG